MSHELRTLKFGQGGRDLLVMLPGAYMKPEGFVAAGFAKVLEKRQIPLDLCLVDLDLTSISAGLATQQLGDAVLTSAKKDYRRVWVGGISLGGFLSLQLAAEHPQLLDGLCLIAPYPGSRITTRAIAAAGGLSCWQPSIGQLAGDAECRVWHWLKAPPATLPVFVGYGREDRFADGMAQLAACFPEPARHLVDGAHDWPAWRSLWDAFLTREDLFGKGAA